MPTEQEKIRYMKLFLQLQYRQVQLASGMIKDKINPKFNPKSNEYKFEQIRPDVPIYKPLSENQIPSIVGNAVDNIASKIIKNKSDEKYKELVDEKK